MYLVGDGTEDHLYTSHLTVFYQQKYIVDLMDLCDTTPV